MFINNLKTNRFIFKNWIRDSQGYWNALSTVTIANKFHTNTLLTILEKDESKINSHTKALCDAILEDLQTIDQEGDDFRPGMLLESVIEDSLPFTLMFF